MAKMYLIFVCCNGNQTLGLFQSILSLPGATLKTLVPHALLVPHAMLVPHANLVFMIRCPLVQYITGLSYYIIILEIPIVLAITVVMMRARLLRVVHFPFYIMMK